MELKIYLGDTIYDLSGNIMGVVTHVNRSTHHPTFAITIEAEVDFYERPDHNAYYRELSDVNGNPLGVAQEIVLDVNGRAKGKIIKELAADLTSPTSRRIVRDENGKIIQGPFGQPSHSGSSMYTDTHINQPQYQIDYLKSDNLKFIELEAKNAKLEKRLETLEKYCLMLEVIFKQAGLQVPGGVIQLEDQQDGRAQNP